MAVLDQPSICEVYCNPLKVRSTAADIVHNTSFQCAVGQGTVRLKRAQQSNRDTDVIQKHKVKQHIKCMIRTALLGMDLLPSYYITVKTHCTTVSNKIVTSTQQTIPSTCIQGATGNTC